MSSTLWRGLIDDAAVFPPGLRPLDAAVREHLDRRTGPDAAQLGPLLVPAASAGELSELAGADERCTHDPLRVGLIVRPGAPTQPLAEAVERLRDDPRVVVTAVELGWTPTWRDITPLGLPIVLEVGAGTEQAAQLDDIAAAVDDEVGVTAKFRTGATPTWPWPTPAVLAQFLDATVLRGLAFKLTGGLHHAVRGEYDDEQQHGLLNVVIATHEALDGAEAGELTGILEQTSAELLTERMALLTEPEAARVRGSFTTFGCCGVLDPLTELAALGLLPRKDAS